ncbi:hypothetical protein ANN_23397, partial [Periplaneta americana]
NVYRTRNYLQPSNDNEYRSMIRLFFLSQQMRVNICVLLAVIVSFTACHSANILTVFSSNSRNDFLIFEPLLKALVSHGHNVTVVRFYPQAQENYTDISYRPSDYIGSKENKLTWEYVSKMGVFGQIRAVIDTLTSTCEIVMNDPKMYEIINSSTTFDLLITHHLSSDCFSAYAHWFNASLINVVTSVAPPWLNDRIGNPDNPSYIPNFYLPYSNRMSFMQRVINTVVNEITKYAITLYCDHRMDELSRQLFGEDIPSVAELRKKTSLVLVNSHFTLSYPRPLVPAFVEVGGLHIKSGGKLPKDLQRYLDNAKQGAIYFSLGSAFKTSSMPQKTLQVFIDVFAQLPQRVLWKVENVTGLPENVNTSSWYPQFEILKSTIIKWFKKYCISNGMDGSEDDAFWVENEEREEYEENSGNHPNLKLFITQGSLMGVMEAVHAGVPMVGIPLIDDQSHNIEMCVSKDVAIRLDINSLNKATLLTAIRHIIYNPRYHKNAKELSELFRDRPHTPLETAVFWTEYVIRHKGAHHLRSAAVDLSLYQYLLLDVIAFLILAATATIVVAYYALKISLIMLYGYFSKYNLKESKLRKKTE